MKLDEAIKLMLEGKVMVDSNGFIYRLDRYFHGAVQMQINNRIKAIPHEYRWDNVVRCFSVDGWREATPEELKEIGL